ncbi:MAG: hypothetical protein U0165_11155 [Polyangiaceae bacterium]
MKRVVGAVVGVLMLAAIGAGVLVFRRDASTSASDPSASLPFGLRATRVEYKTEWKNSRVSSADNAWKVTNDRGAVITVTRGYLTEQAMSLVPCRPKQAWLSFGVQEAWAGPPKPVRDPSSSPSRVLMLGQANDPALVPIGLSSSKYCQASYSIGHAEKSSLGLPSNPVMLRASIHLEGSYQLNGQGEAKPFTFHSSVSADQKKDFDLPAVEPLSGGPVRVVFTRSLDTLFDGIDVENLKGPEVGKKLLSNLLSTLTVRVERAEGG